MPADRVPTARFDYRDHAPDERVAAFQRMTASVYEVRPIGASEAFRAEAMGYRVDDLVFNRVAFSTARFIRDQRHLRSDASDFLVLQHQLTGSELLSMEHGKVRLESGNLYLRDWSFPFDARSTDMRLDSVLIPRQRLRSANVLDRAMPVMSWPAESPEGQLLASSWIALLDLLPRVSLGKAQLLAAGLVAIVDTLLGHSSPARPTKTLRAMEQYLHERLRQDIGVAELCQHFKVSRSQVYRLFEAHDGVQAYVRRQRLQNCYAELRRADPDHARIADIAASWGFQDPSLFSRRFRAAFGQTPSAVLRQARDMPAVVREQFEKAPLELSSYRAYVEWLQQAAQQPQQQA